MKKAEAGAKFGRLLLLERTHTFSAKNKKRAKWLCRCDCGNTPVVSEDSIQRGLTRSCGCLHREVASAQSLRDLTGRRFGRLTVVKRLGSDKTRAAVWLVRCDCGKEKSIRSTSLTFALTQSCGCLQKEVVSLPSGMALRNNVLRGYIYNAKARSLAWGLTEKQFDTLTQSDCHYCGSAPLNTVSKKRYVGSFTYNGIDRKDNAQGYTANNTVPCCMDCNNAKASMPYDRFIAYLRRAGKFQLDKSE
jgi:hypothetical protein